MSTSTLAALPRSPRQPLRLTARRILRSALLAALLLALAAGGASTLLRHGGATGNITPTASPVLRAVPQAFEVVARYPHDRTAFTQGLLWSDGALYESTGLEGRSSLRRVALESGRVLQIRRLPDDIFAEGLAAVPGQENAQLVQLTWKNERAFVYQQNSFELAGEFRYRGEGWGLTFDGSSLIMSDGSQFLTWRDPQTFAETHRVAVTFNGSPLTRLNELEWIDGFVWANVWQTSSIVRINPQSGAVASYLDCSQLLDSGLRRGTEDVLNGIAYDATRKRIFLTGKLWPALFEIKLPAG